MVRIKGRGQPQGNAPTLPPDAKTEKEKEEEEDEEEEEEEEEKAP